MFTGIIEDVGEIRKIVHKGGSRELVICTSLKEIEEGESICVDGVCLTAKRVEKGVFAVDCSRRTLMVTTLEQKKEGDKVNLERAIRVGGRLGGHIVLGHVDGVGRITERSRDGSSILLRIKVPEGLRKYLVERGSIAVDGVSLTVTEVRDNRFSVNIVPYTALKTTLAEKRVGEAVNLEVDVIGKFVERLLSAREGRTEKAFPEGYWFTEGVSE